MMKRRVTKNFLLGSVGCGHLYPVSVQSMTNTHTANVAATIDQILRLAEAGCEIVRVAVPDREAGEALKEIVSLSPLPIVADIHFDYRLALLAIKNGVHGLRLNPGNIGAEWKVKEIVKAAKERNIPIRIGVNSGSLDKKFLEQYGKPTALAMVESALEHINILESLNFDLIKISLKSSQVPLMLEAYRMIAEKTAYPLHLGVTEAGLSERAMIKSAIGIGTLLAEGIGDTIRVSLTGDPCQEIKAAKHILSTLGLRENGVEIISCPTCGRCKIDLASLATEIEQKLINVKIPLKIAVMGCAVNGPGEAREADLGIAGGEEEGLLFVKGKIKKKLPENQLVHALMDEIDKMIKENENK
ncbi:MAG: flavodoxin-dependent (E)-4-hydroxy-3-methylbut-2-enyl-diphosphate synthase [Clostridia bacterium]|jgi:(E)-4-hydroxy-3-methylbut-2-enyl-diphosphate synthase|nr:flavodoxin-dependent (E)-4-hydroxy-3-methylbut-2-enyl-diphosphate synthase [Clostridia bacterium]